MARATAGESGLRRFRRSHSRSIAAWTPHRAVTQCVSRPRPSPRLDGGGRLERRRVRFGRDEPPVPAARVAAFCFLIPVRRHRRRGRGGCTGIRQSTAPEAGERARRRNLRHGLRRRARAVAAVQGRRTTRRSRPTDVEFAAGRAASTCARISCAAEMASRPFSSTVCRACGTCWAVAAA